MKMTWYDTHCHLDSSVFSDDLERVLKHARLAGVKKIIVPGTNGSVTEFAQAGFIFRSWGVHPAFAGEWNPSRIFSEFEKIDYKPICIGECGLDSTISIPMQIQQEVFVAQLAIACKHGLPVSVHLRGNWDSALDFLSRHAGKVHWVMHAFCGSLETARRYIRKGAYISFAGSISRPSARKTVRVAAEIPEERILLETDSPDMSPGFRKCRINEPVTIAGTGYHIARIRNTDPLDFSEKVAQNTCKVFGWT